MDFDACFWSRRAVLCHNYFPDGPLIMQSGHMHIGATQKQRVRNQRLLIGIIVVVAAMVGLAFASVPLYQLFCQVTGYGGTTQRAKIAPQTFDIAIAPVSVRFNAVTNAKLNWSFVPVTRPVVLVPGEQVTAVYRATNLGDVPSTGTATFNVTPQKAGPYFMKLECFCFVDKTLQPGESMDMPVTFFLDPEMAADANTANVDEVVLSYTFFEAMES